MLTLDLTLTLPCPSFVIFVFVCFFGCARSSLPCRLSLVALRGGSSLFWCLASLCSGLFGWSMDSRVHGLSSCSPWPLSTGSIAVIHRLSCFVACGIFLDQGSNLCLLHQQMDSLPLNHQGSPTVFFFPWEIPSYFL